MLVDDHAMLRHGMAMLINMEPDMEVIAEAGDGNEAIAYLKKIPLPISFVWILPSKPFQVWRS